MVATKVAAGLLAQYSNNTASCWWNDKGLVKLNAILLAIFAVSITSGFDNSLINNLQSLDTFLVALDHPNASTLGLVGAFGTIGAAVGAIPGAYIGDMWGRKNGLAFGSSVAIVGVLLQTFSHSVIQYIVGRAVVGFSGSCILINGASLVNELAHPRLRGKTGGFFNVIWYVGAIIASWTCYGTKIHIPSEWQWRLPTLLQIVPAIWTLSLRLWVPESPRWLIRKGRTEEAAVILFKYHANGDHSDEMVKAEIEEIARTIALEGEAKAAMSWKRAFTGKANQKRMLVAAMFGTSIAWTSQSIISYYNTAIYKQAGITSSLSQLQLNGGLTIADLFAAFGGATLSGYIGRKQLLYVGFGGMLIAHIVVTGLAATYARTGESAVGYGIIACIWVESIMYNVGINPLTYLYPVEVMSFALRAKGVAFFLFVTDIWGIVTRYSNPVALANLGWKYYIVFIFCYILTLTGIYFVYPETRNKTLEEIEAGIDGLDAEEELGRHSPTVEAVEFVPGKESDAAEEKK